MIKILILLFLFNWVLADPRCPFPICRSTYYSYGCEIYCQETEFPDRGNQTTKIYYIQFTQLTKLPANAFKNLEIINLRIRSNDLIDVHDRAFSGILQLDTFYLDYAKNTSLFFTGELDPLENLTRIFRIDQSSLDIEKLNFILKDIQNWSQLYALSITSNNLKEFNYNFNDGFTSLTELTISNNKIEKFNITSNKLTYLNLVNNLITDFDSTSLKSIPNLNQLDLTLNQIGNFQFLIKTNLRILSLSNNNIRNLTNRTFENLSTLTTLYLSGCQINQIEAGTFCNFFNLQFLSLSQNDLSTTKLYCLDSLTYLDLSSVNYSGLITQEHIGNPLNVNNLYLSNNKIESLELKKLSNIYYLYAQNNKLKNLSNETMAAISSVYYADFSNNKLEELGILAWKKIVYLFLSGNNLKEIRTQSLEQMSSLTFFYASNNLIERIQFPDLPALQTVQLAQNKLREIKKYVFMGLKGLVKLYLNFNLISKIEAKSFDKNKNLETLVLNNNMLTTTPDISKLIVLNTLNLNSNQIDSLPNNAFERNISEADIAKSKIQISLNGNNITQFSSKTFCSQYTYSLGFLGVEIRLEDVNKMNVCLLKQLHSDDTQLYSNKKVSCEHKDLAKLHDIDLIDGSSNLCNLTTTYDECENETLFKCPHNQEFVRFTSWITGDPHVYSYKNKYELCTLGEDAVCFQHDDYVLLCTDQQVGKTNMSATVLTELEFIYKLSNETNVTFTATKDHFPTMFSNKMDKIYANESENEVLVELIKYPDMRIIFINESKTHIFITKYGSFYSVTLRATHETYAESSGVLYEGCENEMKNVSVRRKRSVQRLNCSMECSNFSLSFDDENVPEDVLRDACAFDCEHIGDEAIVWLKNTDAILSLMNQSDNARLESSLIVESPTTTPNYIISEANRLLINSIYIWSLLIFLFF